MCLSVAIVASLTFCHGSANAQNKTSINATKINIVLVHGQFADASSWSKVFPFLQDAGHKVIAVELPLHSMADDVTTVKRAIDLIGEPVPVAHSYGGFVITNAGYNNPNVKGLVYIAAVAPKEGQTENTAKNSPSPKVFEGKPVLIFDKSGIRVHKSSYIPRFFCSRCRSSSS